ncbi:MAG: Hsp20/alpha crystallin family protein [Bacteroidota bacterium]
MTLVKANNGYYPGFSNVFDDFFSDNWLTRSTQKSSPAVNIIDNENEFVIDVAAPGYEKGDFNVNVDNDVLTISVEKESEQENNESNFARREFSYSSFERRFNLPRELVDVDKVEAKYENGILHVQVPKREELKPKPARAIEIH